MNVRLKNQRLPFFARLPINSFIDLYNGGFSRSFSLRLSSSAWFTSRARRGR